MLGVATLVHRKRGAQMDIARATGEGLAQLLVDHKSEVTTVLEMKAGSSERATHGTPSRSMCKRKHSCTKSPLDRSSSLQKTDGRRAT